MLTLLLIIGLVVLVVAFALIYRVLALVSVAKATRAEQGRVGKSNAINGFLFIVFFVVGFGLFFWYSGIASKDFLPDASSDQGVKIDQLFWITNGITFFAFFITHCLLFFAPYIFRFKETKKALWYPHNNKLELIWTIIPAMVLTGLVVSGWKVWSDVMSPAPEKRVEVELMGKQFNWQVRYGGADQKLGKYVYTMIDETNAMGMDFINDKNNLDDFIPNEIHVPKGMPVLLKIRARDVLHSVYMPHFRVKMDAVPGMPTQFWFTPNKSTAEMRKELKNDKFNYELACAEICGGGHFAMRMLIVVDEPADYQKWYTSQKTWASLNKEYVDQKLTAAKQPMTAEVKQ